MTTTTTRRALLAATAAAPLAAMPGLALASAGDDAELLTLIERYRAAIAYTNSGLDSDEAIDAAGDAETALYDAVLLCPARTPAGLLAKLRVYADLLGWDAGDPIEPTDSMDERGLAAVMLDAERLLGRAQA